MFSVCINGRRRKFVNTVYYACRSNCPLLSDIKQSREQKQKSQRLAQPQSAPRRTSALASRSGTRSGFDEGELKSGCSSFHQASRSTLRTCRQRKPSLCESKTTRMFGTQNDRRFYPFLQVYTSIILRQVRILGKVCVVHEKRARLFVRD